VATERQPTSTLAAEMCDFFSKAFLRSFSSASSALTSSSYCLAKAKN